MSVIRGAVVAMLLASMSGCTDERDFRDLDAYMAEWRERAPEQIEPLPTFHASRPVADITERLRSPFLLPAGSDPIARRPALQRRRHYLEGFDIDQFEMLGTLAGAGGTFVLLKGAGGLHRLQVGDYLGRSDGRVKVIGASHVEVVEVVADGHGGWRERSRTFSLNTHS